MDAITFGVRIAWEHAVWTDETERLRHVHTRSGFARPYDRIPAVGRCELVLDNQDRRFTPTNTGSALYGNLVPRKAVEVFADDGETEYTLFRGLIETIEPGAGDWNGRDCRMTAVDAVAVLSEQRVSLEMDDRRPYDVIYPLVYLDVVDTDIHTGDERLSDVGKDWTPENTSKLDAIRQTCEALYGRFWIDRDGTAIYWTRGDQQDPTAATALTVGADYRVRVLGTQAKNLVGYWRLNESAGTGVADSSGNAYAGTASGVTWGAAGVGDGATAATFDGLNDWIDLASSGAQDAFDEDAGTVMVWFRYDSLAAPAVDFLFYFRTTNGNQLYANMNTDKRIWLWHRSDAGATQLYRFSSVLTDEDWHHLAVTWDTTAGELKLYLDGTQQGASAASFGTWTTPAWLHFSITHSGNSWAGDLAHFALWNTALSGAEIAALVTVS